MAEADEIIAQLTKNPSFLDYLRSNATGRGVPTWTDAPNTGKYGGFKGWQPGMPRAPGNSPGVGRLGGTYTPSGAAPIPQAGMPPVGGTGVGGPPAPITGGGFGSVMRYPGMGLLAPAAAIASQRDRPNYTPDQMASGLARWRVAQQGTAPLSATAIHPVQYGGALPAPASPTSAPVASNALRIPVGHPPVPPPTRPWPGSQTVAQGPVPLPTPRPQPAVPVPMPRPQMAQQRVPVPTPRPAPAVQGNQLDQVLRSLFGRPMAYDHQAVNTANL